MDPNGITGERMVDYETYLVPVQPQPHRYLTDLIPPREHQIASAEAPP
jgi:hypothetical protein